MSLLLALFFLFPLITKISCPPTQFSCANGDGKYSFNDCTQYYVCQNSGTSQQKITLKNCPNNLLFDNAAQNCERDVICGSAAFICPGNGNFPNCNKPCKSFYSCSNVGQATQTIIEFNCPYVTLFNLDKNVCDWPENVGNCGC